MRFFDLLCCDQSSYSMSSEADLVDADFLLTELDQSLFPGVSTSILVHDGFKDAHARYVS